MNKARNEYFKQLACNASDNIEIADMMLSDLINQQDGSPTINNLFNSRAKLKEAIDQINYFKKYL